MTRILILRLLLLIFYVSLGSMSFYSSTARAQADTEENFDPFTDYSEYDDASDEEADINFFRNGRFLNFGLLAGYRGFTGNYARAYKPALLYGFSFSYFFDLRLALSLGYQTGDHGVSFKTLGTVNSQYQGDVSFSTIDVNLKYYFNTKNVTRGLADLNPYFIGGFSQYTRTYNLTNVLPSGSERVFGLNIGGGIEIPMLKRKNFLGIQLMYHPVTFSDETREFVEEASGSSQLEYPLNGDLFDLAFIFGFNF